MNLYFTDAIGCIRPGLAKVKAISEADAIHKIIEYVQRHPQYQLYKTKPVVGNTYVISMTSVDRVMETTDSVPDIDILDTGGLNEEPSVGNGVRID